jgi:beta-lactamase class D
MRILSVYFTFLFFLSCTFSENKSILNNMRTSSEKRSISGSFQEILDSNKLNGTILIYEASKNHWYSNDFEASEKPYSVASTFKITNAIIGMETGTIDQNYIFKWDSIKRNNTEWSKNLTLFQAFKASCLPCFQELARKIGSEQMSKSLKRFNYPDLIIDSTNLDKFWINGQLKLSPFQQIELLKKIVNNKANLKSNTLETIKNLMFIEENNEIKFYGKTGWTIENDIDLGWFIGYAIYKNELYYVATIIKPEIGFNMNTFGKIRYEISRQALEMIIL